LPATPDSSDVTVYSTLGPSAISVRDWHATKRVLPREQERALRDVLERFRAQFPAATLVPASLTLPLDVGEMEYVKNPVRSVPSLWSRTTFTWHRDGRVTNVVNDRSSRSPKLDSAIVNTLGRLGEDRTLASLPFGDAARTHGAPDSIHLALEISYHPDPAVATAPLAVIRAPSYHEVPALPLAGTPHPPYPANLRGQTLDGRVLVQFAVDTLGRVNPHTVRVLESTHSEFTSAVLAVLPEWRLRPTRLNGCLVEAAVQQPFAFVGSRR
jgi:TonB family protein